MSNCASDISLKYLSDNEPLNELSASILGRPVVRLTIGLTFSALIGRIGYRKGSLNGSGVAGAIVSGTLTTARGGYGRAALLVGFFAASSLISRLPAKQDDQFASFTAKGDQRDAWQVAANGGVSTLLAALGNGEPLRLAYLGALAAATGDTWATEIGRRSGHQPRHILTWELVPAGTSGGITLVGTLATIGGGAFLGGLATLTRWVDPAFRSRRGELILTGTAAGMIGSLVDSLAGGTIQERRWCNQCQKPTERRIHRCGSETRITSGIRGIDNDVVNLICTISGAATGWTMGLLLRR